MTFVSNKDNRQSVVKTANLPIWRKRSLAVFISQALAISTAQAATIYVGQNNCTLGDAITAANTDKETGGCDKGHGTDTIELENNQTYILNAIDNTTQDPVDPDFWQEEVDYTAKEEENLTITGHNGLPDISSRMTINGNSSIIQRDDSSSSTPKFRIFHVSKGGNLTLNNVTIRDGNANGNAVTELNNGGGIYMGPDSVVTLDGCQLDNNVATYGGSIYNRLGQLTIKNSIISGSESKYGGAIYNKGSFTLNDSIITGNKATKQGGGIYDDGDLDDKRTTSITINNSTISGNTSNSHGGGIYHDDGKITIKNSTISGNTSGGLSDCIPAHGGGIYHDDGEIIINNSTISGNTASGQGGGIYHDDGEITISNGSKILQNTSDGKKGGGGLYFDDGKLSLSNSTISNNHAKNGGGIYINESSSNTRISIKQSYIQFNQATNSGGGIYHLNNGGHKTSISKNTTISGNSAKQGPQCSTYIDEQFTDQCSP